MSRSKIKIDTKKIEKKLNKQLDNIIESAKKEIRIKREKEENDMNVMSQNAEDMLNIFLEKYKQTNNYLVNGLADEFPESMSFCIEDTMKILQNNNCISSHHLFVGGEWDIMLTPDGLEYFEKKGMRTELFNILVKDEEKLLQDLIEMDDRNDNITEFLQEKIKDDSKNIFRGIIGTLKRNGLISVTWADNTVYNVELTQAGRTYFERKLYNKNNNSIYNITANNSTVFTGNITNSNINIDNSILKIQEEIEEKCDNANEKQELIELLEEAKEIMENFEKSGNIGKRRTFFNKMSNHLDKHGWFYAEIVSLFGQAVMKLLS